MKSPFAHMDERLRRLPDPVILIIGLAIVAGTTAFRVTVGTGIPVADFILIPVAGVGWLARSRVYGYVAAVCAAFATVLIPILGGGGTALLGAAIALAVVRLVLYVVVLALLGAIRRLQTQSEDEARTDHQTGVANARGFEALAAAEIERSRRSGDPLTLLYLDIDDFKDVNDSFGHTAGDALLASVSHMMRASVRVNDVVARLGGDEFVVLMPGANHFAAAAVARRMREQLARVRTPAGAPIHCSMGLATMLRPPGSVDELIHAADELMYRAKDAGKDRIVAADLPAAASRGA